jgi:hypothetical protein
MKESDEMSEHEQHPKPSPDPGHPAEGGGTLPEGSRPQGEASVRKGHVERDAPKAGKGGDETHGAGEHDDPSN